MSIYKNNISKLFTKISFGIFFIFTLLFSPSVFAQIDSKNNSSRDSLQKLIIRKKPKISLDSFKTQRYRIEQDSSKKILIDTSKIKNDSLKNGGLSSELYHYAEDYTEINQKKKFIKLYNKAHIKYKDFELSAGVIYVDYGKKEVYAGRIPDSLGKPSQRPVFVQGSTKTENDSIRFNYETKKALVWNTYTKEGDISLLSEVSKKYNDSVMFVADVKFTTSEDREHPEYYFLAKKGKIVPGKKIIVGTTQMWIEDVPTPFVIPFGFFPLMKTRASGFIVPNFGQSNKGFFLQNGGFYWAVNPYLDLTTTTDFYTNGSYALHLNSRYKKRYRYNGSFTFNYENQISSVIGLPDYSKNTLWNITWDHHKDSKSSPLSNFSANVTFGSSNYYRNSDNYYVARNVNNQLQNNINSSVSYTQNFRNLPVHSTITLSNDQVVSQKKITLTLPQISLNTDRLYPFAKNGVKKNAFQKINLNYTFDAKNTIRTTDSLLFTKRVWEGKEVAARHRIPLKTDIKLFKYFNFQPSINYQKVWALQYIEKRWDPTANNGNGQEIIEEKTGFKSFRSLNMNASLSTNIFGTYLFGDDKKIMGIRHTITPSFSYSYRPKFKQFIKEYEKSPGETVEYTEFDRNMYGKPDITENKNLIMALTQVFEAKYKTKDGKTKRLRFLTISNSYNFLKDSMQLSQFNLTSNFQLTKGLNINLTSVFDPYDLHNGIVSKEFAITNGNGPGRFQSFTLNTGYNFSNKTFEKTSDDKNDKKNQEIKAYYNPINWNLKLTYDFRYTHPAYNPSNPKAITGNTLNFSGDVNFTENWRVGFRSGYDLVNKGFTITTLNFTRDLKSWVMRFDWKPLGRYKSWYFYIGIKSSILKDIKYDKRSEPLRKFF